MFHVCRAKLKAPRKGGGEKGKVATGVSGLMNAGRCFAQLRGMGRGLIHARLVRKSDRMSALSG